MEKLSKALDNALDLWEKGIFQADRCEYELHTEAKILGDVFPLWKKISYINRTEMMVLMNVIELKAAQTLT